MSQVSRVYGKPCRRQQPGGDGGDMGLMVYKSWADLWHRNDALPPAERRTARLLRVFSRARHV